MASRTLSLRIQESGTTGGEGDKLDFDISSGTNSAFGSHNPTTYSISFNTSYLYADYASNVTMKWSIALKINGSRYEIYAGSKSMSKSNSNFDSSGSLPSNVISLLKSYPIDEVSIYQDGSRVIKGTSSATGTLTINYTEVYPSLGTPAAPTITQNPNGTYTASWNAVSYSNGSGSPQYRLWSVSDGQALSSYSTNRSVTLDIGAYGTSLQFRVQATYSGLTTNGSTTTKTFTKPTLSTPSGVKVNQSTGESVTLSWSASTISATTGTITYSIRKNGTQIATTNSTSKTFDKATVSTWGSSAVTLTVVATASTANKHYPSLTSGTSSGVSFTYKPAAGTISYFNGSSWVKCQVYYFDGSNWKLCNPAYYTGSAWKNCSTS